MTRHDGYLAAVRVFILSDDLAQRMHVHPNASIPLFLTHWLSDESSKWCVFNTFYYWSLIDFAGDGNTWKISQGDQ